MGRKYRRYDYYQYYEKTTPIPVKNGISLKSKRGSIVQNWWSKQWITYLESLNIGARLSRGKSYARRGQIRSIDIQNGKVYAKVQGSSRTPYRVEISMKSISDKNWSKVITLLASKALYASKLLNGKMPQDIKDIFQESGVNLFPKSYHDLYTDCSCPDYANPCKHIAAVYYVLAEKFDENPFFIFELRGKSQSNLISLLRNERSKIATEKAEISSNSNQEKETLDLIQPASLDSTFYFKKGNKFFWEGDHTKFHNSISIHPSNLNSQLLDKIEESPLIFQNLNFTSLLKEIYSKLTKETLKTINH